MDRLPETSGLRRLPPPLNQKQLTAFVVSLCPANAPELVYGQTCCLVAPDAKLGLFSVYYDPHAPAAASHLASGSDSDSDPLWVVSTAEAMVHLRYQGWQVVASNAPAGDLDPAPTCFLCLTGRDLLGATVRCGIPGQPYDIVPILPALLPPQEVCTLPSVVSAASVLWRLTRSRSCFPMLIDGGNGRLDRCSRGLGGALSGVSCCSGERRTVWHQRRHGKTSLQHTKSLNLF